LELKTPEKDVTADTLAKIAKKLSPFPIVVVKGEADIIYVNDSHSLPAISAWPLDTTTPSTVPPAEHYSDSNKNIRWQGSAALAAAAYAKELLSFVEPEGRASDTVTSDVPKPGRRGRPQCDRCRVMKGGKGVSSFLIYC
jgi:hypothetical protein